MKEWHNGPVKIRRAIPICAAVSLALAVGTAGANAQLDAPGAFDTFSNCLRHTCVWNPFSAHRTFHQGDLAYTVKADDDSAKEALFQLRRGKKVLLSTPLKDLSASVSVVWSADGSHFAITWSDAGDIGRFHVLAFRIEGDSVTRLPATKQAWTAFTSRHWCKTRGDNIQAYGWYPESQALVLVLSVYPAGDCGKDLGHMEGFVVDAATGEIKENWDVKQLDAYMGGHPQ